jgi:two-component system, LytTR family, response regulator
MESRRHIRAVIVDDEPLGRELIREMLKRDPEVEVVGECANGREAVQSIKERLPDLVFLDVQMPDIDGFEVLEAIEHERMPMVIFVTAYDQYAVKAFDVYALDYLLKPVDRERFEKAMKRVKSQLQRGITSDVNEKLTALLEEVRMRSGFLERMVIKTGGRVIFLRTEEIDWIEAEGNYVKLHVGKDAYLLREGIGTMEERLDTNRFMRIHRSTIVNIDQIQEMRPWFGGDSCVILRGGAQLTLSRSYQRKLQELLGRKS